MSKPYLIIGRNSSLVQAVQPLLKHPFELASHNDLDSIDWRHYAEVFVFSWPNGDFDSFLERLDCIPTGQIIFVSTTAVLALQRRPQWSPYPREKHRFEQHILARGGRVIRIGVTNESHSASLVGAFPFTSLMKLGETMDLIGSNTDPVINAFDINLGKAYGCRRWVSVALHQLSLALPSIGPVQMVVHGLAKALGLKHYGYTADANYFFRRKLQIGYGALGRVGPTLRSLQDLIVTSPFADEVLNAQGFSNTRLGRNTTGLSRLWHGVELLAESQPGLWRKRVPLWIDRSRPPKFLHAALHVDKLLAPEKGGAWTVLGQDKYQSDIRYWCQELVLAAGPIGNARLLQGLFPEPTTFSDHEIAMVGTAPIDNVVDTGFVRHGALLMYPGHLQSLTTNCGLRFLVEARPHTPRKHINLQKEDLAFYLDSTLAIIDKLLKNFDFKRINEAVYNKLGFALSTRNCSIFVQVLVPEAIKLAAPDTSEGTDSLQRVRLTPFQWRQIQSEISRVIPNFIPDPEVTSVDAQHILGGVSLLASPQLAKVVDSGKLSILGSPTLFELDEKHHTCRLQREIRAAFQPVLLFLPINPQSNGGHDEIVSAIEQYARPWRVHIAEDIGSARRHSAECRAIFFQKTALSNIPLALLAAIRGIPRILYLHEPLSVAQRRQKGVPWFKAVLVTLFQMIEVGFMNRLLTGNPKNKNFNGRTLKYAPLLFPPVDKPTPNWSCRKGFVLYFGRIDKEKFFEEFQKFSLQKTIIATSNLNIQNYEGPVSHISVEEKREQFQSHRFVWCVQKHSLTQSAVLIDAIKFGCCAILRHGDPICEMLHPAAYVTLPEDFNEESVISTLQEYEKTYPKGPDNTEGFSKLCGQDAFDQYWRPQLLDI